MGSGAYVCGEETAMIESLEGHRGEPRNRPPFPIDTGYLGRPTIVNNVETFAWVVCILARGPEWFKSHGTDKSSGYKLFSVSGDCELPGVYEFPMGITIAKLLKEVKGEGAKAVQVGGASGQCVPSSQFDRTLAFEDASTGGSVMVFGGAATCSTWSRTSWSFSSTSRAASVRRAAKACPSCSKASNSSSRGNAR